MEKYRVWLNRYSTASVVIEATSEDEAKRVAAETVIWDDLNWTPEEDDITDAVLINGENDES